MKLDVTLFGETQLAQEGVESRPRRTTGAVATFVLKKSRPYAFGGVDVRYQSQKSFVTIKSLALS